MQHRGKKYQAKPFPGFLRGFLWDFWVKGLLVGLVVFSGITSKVSAQATKVFANQVTFTSGNNKSTLTGCGILNLNPCLNLPTVLNPLNALTDNGTYSRLLASPGLAVGLASYSGGIELKFPTTPPNTNLPAGTVSYVRIGADPELLKLLLGGSVGNLLGNVVNSILLGRQGIEIQVRNSSGTQILSRTSSQRFNTQSVRLVQDAQGAYYLRIQPNQPYDRIRIINSSISLLGLGTEYRLDVFNAFYNIPDPCATVPAYTSYDGSGTSLSLLQLNQLVTDPNYAIDNNALTSSRISLGIVALMSSTEQFVYFDTPIRPGNDILVSLGIEGVSLLNLDLFNSIEFRLYSDTGIARTVLANELIGLDLLGLFNSGASYDFPISLTEVDPPISRIGVRISSLVSAGLLNANLKFSGVKTNPTPPSVDGQINGGDYEICQGDSRVISVDPPLSTNSQMTWYSDQSGSNILNTGSSYSIPDNLEPGEHIYYVRSSLAGCSQRSLPTEINVRVEPSPNQNDIGIEFQGGYFDAGLNRYIYQAGIEQVEIAPNYTIIPGGSFTWYSDPEGQQPLVLNEPDLNGAVFSVNAVTGRLIITNTSKEVEDYEIFVGYITPAGCRTIKPLVLENFIILPLQIHKFEVEAKERRQVNLIWELSNEQQQGTVTVQRASSDLEFVDLDELSLISTGERVSMKFTDSSPLPGRNYYRLLITKEDNSSSFYSEVRMAEIGEYEMPPFLVFPSPFTSFFTVKSSVELDIPVFASLLSTNGVLIRQVRMQKLSFGDQIEFQDLGSLPAGVYILKMETARGSKSYRVMKRHN